MMVEIRNLTKKYGRLKALDHVSLEISPGDIMAVLGENGAGKTTLLRCLAGMARQNEGEILYDGEVFDRGRLDLRKRLFFLPDIPTGFKDCSIIQHISMALTLYEVDSANIEDRVVDILRDFDLLSLCSAPLQDLSRGQLYKAGLAALFAVDPEVWLIDEPFASGMDPHGMAVFRKYAQDAAQRGRTVLYSTQILAIAENYCARFCLLSRGAVHMVDSVSRLRQLSAEGDGVLEEIFEALREE